MGKASIEKNLTEGNVVQLIQLALPYAFESDKLYNVADMLIVGKYSGTVGISGVT